MFPQNIAKAGSPVTGSAGLRPMRVTSNPFWQFGGRGVVVIGLLSQRGFFESDERSGTKSHRVRKRHICPRLSPLRTICTALAFLPLSAVRREGRSLALQSSQHCSDSRTVEGFADVAARRSCSGPQRGGSLPSFNSDQMKHYKSPAYVAPPHSSTDMGRRRPVASIEKVTAETAFTRTSWRAWVH